MLMRWARSRTITGGFICTTLLPFSSTMNAGWVGVAGAGEVGRGAGAGGDTGRCAVVIFTVGWGVGAALGGAGGFGAATGADAAAWMGVGGATNFAGASWGVSGITFGGSATGAGAG